MGRRDDEIFRFKHFECRHGRSSMKISADSILLGAWCNPEGQQILDIGTGCGILSLMCAQRNDHALIHAIDIDKDSIEEASLNFQSSPWNDRLFGEESDFLEFTSLHSFDLIISNPPYFDSGILHPETTREKARHDSSLPLHKMLAKASIMLAPNGRIALILPIHRSKQLYMAAEKCNLIPERSCVVKGHEEASAKRIMIELIRNEDRLVSLENSKSEIMILRDSDYRPSESYRKLCSEFYLKF